MIDEHDSLAEADALDSRTQASADCAAALPQAGVGHRRKAAIPTVCIVVLNWRDADTTLRCMESLADTVHAGLACLVVCDNNSEDGSAEAIAAWAECKRFPASASADASAPFTLIETGKNGGYAFGNNQGIKFALQYPQFDHVWILNNDTQVEAGSLEALLDCARTDVRAGLIGSTVVEMKNPDIIQCAGGCRYHPLLSISQDVAKGLRRETVLRNPAHYSSRIDYIIGAAFFVRLDLIRKIGLLCEDYFLYFEELDFVRRMNGSGYTLRWCPTSVVRHADRTPSSLREYHAHRSVLLFSAKWHPWFLPLILALRMLLRPALMLARGHSDLIRGAYGGMRDFFHKRRPDENESSPVKILPQASKSKKEFPDVF